ncbi:MAG: hypothetical protein EBR30_15190 [Cytophagia bacterium]|nr:hypothetical protein [Cytophagia bacterium]
MKNKLFFLLVSLLIGGETFSQIPIELFLGHEKATLDVMFFKYIKNNEQENSKFLFFNRNRTSIDYDQTSTSRLPSFGFTEAVSFNHPALKSFAPVAVVQVLNSGLYPKAGIQYFFHKKDFTFFSWLVCETLKQPNIDFFILSRYEPHLTQHLSLFLQLESFSARPTTTEDMQQYLQRLRLGLKINTWQFGLGGDFNQAGNKYFSNTHNLGVFVRHEFN